MKLRVLVWAQILLYALLVGSCVTEFQPDAVSISRSLIVEGMITDQPGPYTVRLTRTADYSYKSLNLIETGATVTISDDAGNQETLTEQAPGGTYQTSATGIQGVAGRIYKVTITTSNGEQYESDPERLKASPPIEKVYAEYSYNANAVNNGKANGWDVYIDTKDPETTGDFYRWEWTHYEFTEACLRTFVANPFPGYYDGTPCCSNCWDITHCYSNCINVLSDASINGNYISRQYIQHVDYNSSGRYYLEVTQQRLSQGIYEFFKSTKQQVSNTGGLFDVAPSSIGGNIHSTSNPKLKVYGYFGAAGVSVSYIQVDRSQAVGNPYITDLPTRINPLAPCMACQNDAYRTPNKPRWWDE